jgi:hypothetical protein
MADTVGTARNEFLTAMATVIAKSATALDPASVATVAEKTAADVAQAHGVSSAELLAALPDPWRTSPGSYAVKTQTNAFLEVAEPVLGVQASVVKPLAARALALSSEAAFAVAVHKAQRARTSDSPALQKAIDFDKLNLRALVDDVAAAGADKAFGDLIGAGRVVDADGLAREFAGALTYAMPAPENEGSVLAGGVEVAGPNVRKAYQDRPFGLFRDVPAQTTAGALATALGELAVLRKSVGPRELAGALGAGIMPMSGLPDGCFPLHVGITEKGAVGVGLGIDVAKLRSFIDMDIPDVEYVKRVGGMLREMDAVVQKLVAGGAPAGFVLDRNAMASQTVKDLLG